AGAGPSAGPSPARRWQPSLNHPPAPALLVLPGPLLPLSVAGKTTQLARCQVPTPVLSPVVPGAMTSVPFVPRRTCTCGCFGAPSTGLQMTGPLTVAAPGFGKTATFSWIPIELSLASAATIDFRWLICTSTEPLLISVMLYAVVTTFLMPPAARTPSAV